MANNIDPTNQTSVEYGQSLLTRKYKQEEKVAKEARKDRKIAYAMQVLGGVDKLIKDRYTRNIAERNAGFDQDIIRETAEFNRLNKIYDSQAEWRKYEEMGPTAVYGYARQLANTDLTAMYGDPKTLPIDGEIRKDYNRDLKRITEQYHNNYKNNKITMPFETAEEYTADLEALKRKRVPSGLLDSVLRKTGLRSKDARAALDLEIANRRTYYADKLAERKDVKGSVDNLTDEDKTILLRTPPPVKSLVEYETTIKNGLGEEVSAIGIKTKVGNETRITGYRFPGSSEVVSNIQFYGSTKKSSTMLLNQAESKIRKMEDMEDASKRQIQNYIFENSDEFPDLKAQMYTHDLVIPRIKAFDSDEEGYLGIAEGAVSNIQNNPDHSSYNAVRTMKDNQKEALAIGILESMKAINENGRLNEDGTITYLTDTTSIMELATEEQLTGVSFAGRGIKTNVATYNMVTPRSLAIPFKTLSPEKGDTDETIKSKGTHIINKLVASTQFDNASFEERRSYVEKIEEKYGVEFEVPYDLLNAPATPMVEEEEEVEVEVDTDKKSIDEQVKDLKKEEVDTDISPELLRPDGTEKDPTGFLGPIKNNVTGGIMSEVSMGIGPKDNQKLIPLLVPTLTEKEIETLQNMELEDNVDNIPQSIKDKAIRHAQEREEKGLSPFYGGGNLGERPEGAQLELTSDDPFIPFTSSEVSEATVDDAQDFLDREQNLLSPSRPEFRELTTEEKTLQRREEIARKKEARDTKIAKAKAERDYNISPEGKKLTKIAREKREQEILEKYGLTKEDLYDTFIDPNRHDKNRIQKYVDGKLSKNRKIGSTKGLVGEVLVKYGLENMTRPEIKEWLKETPALEDKFKTAYSPSNIREELDKGNPVFVGDYNDLISK